MPDRVVVVAAEGGLLREYCRSIAGTGADVHAVDSFDGARDALAGEPPALLVTAVRLREYNGIHLALIARQMSPPVRTIVVGDADAVLQAESEAAGAVYVAESEPDALRSAAIRLLSHRSPARRWERKPVADVLRGRIGEALVRVIDVSYGGFRVEVPRPAARTLERGFELHLPEYGIAEAAWRVWQEGRAGADTLLCGAAVSDLAQRGGSAWRAFVDSLGAPLGAA